MKYLLLIPALALAQACDGSLGDVSCDEDSAEVAFARSLSSERLTKLVDDSRALLISSPGEDSWGAGETAIPHQFADLHPKMLRSVRGGELRVRLKGCMDHHIDLVVESERTPTPVVVLQWGEAPTVGRQILLPK